MITAEDFLRPFFDVLNEGVGRLFLLSGLFCWHFTRGPGVLNGEKKQEEEEEEEKERGQE